MDINERIFSNSYHLHTVTVTHNIIILSPFNSSKWFHVVCNMAVKSLMHMPV